MNKKMRTIITISILTLLSVSNLDAQSLIVVSPTGNEPPDDAQAVQAAVNAVDPGGTVLLKATNAEGDLIPFKFGDPVNWVSAGHLDNNTRRVLINKGPKYSVRKTIKAIH